MGQGPYSLEGRCDTEKVGEDEEPDEPNKDSDDDLAARVAATQQEAKEGGPAPELRLTDEKLTREDMFTDWKCVVYVDDEAGFQETWDKLKNKYRD